MITSRISISTPAGRIALIGLTTGCRPRRSWPPAARHFAARRTGGNAQRIRDRKSLPRGVDPSPAGDPPQCAKALAGCTRAGTYDRAARRLLLDGHDHLHMIDLLTGPSGTRVPAVGVPSAAPGRHRQGPCRLQSHRIDGSRGVWQCESIRAALDASGEVVQRRAPGAAWLHGCGLLNVASATGAGAAVVSRSVNPRAARR